MKKLIHLLLVLLLIIPFTGKTQTDSTRKDTIDYYELSLEQLLNIKAHGVPTELEKLINSLIAVASKKPLNTRESPSIVSLITEDEIKRSGARDLIDVLRLVPGIDFGVDVEGVVGLGMRGNWAHEGKVLLLLDGQEMNEIMFATTQFGNHFPVEQIKKIEVIRGPGSAIYGGFAEYGVINIVTRQAEDVNGIIASGTYGQMQSAYARRNVNLSIGKKTDNYAYSLSGMIGQGQRSDQNFTDFSDSTYNMAGNSNLNPAYVNGYFGYKDLSVRCIGDFFRTTVRDNYDKIKPSAYPQAFNSIYSEIKYVLKIDDRLTITPRINFKSQTPWKTPYVDSITPEYNKTARRTTLNLTASYNVTRNFNIVFGAERYTDVAVDRSENGYFSNGDHQITYNNTAGFAQGLVKTRFVNIILGARYDHHSAYGDAFVPRVGVTKKYKRFHFKALYSNSFRAPAIENINGQTDAGIKPEKTQVAELELGYQVTRKSIITVNFFDITTKNPIVYFYDTIHFVDAYINFGQSGTQGAEAEFRIKDKWGYVTLNYAYYTAANKPKISDYEVADDKNALLAFANHRINLNSSFNLVKGLSVNPSVSLYGPRWAYTSVDSLGNSVLEKLPSTTLINFFFYYSTPVKGLTVGLGVYDLLDQKFKFVQPYNGYHAPLPAQSREYVMRLQYRIPFKKKSD